MKHLFTAKEFINSQLFCEKLKIFKEMEYTVCLLKFFISGDF